MALFEKTLEHICETDLQQLVENRINESYQIEYKQGLPCKDDDKKKLLMGLTAFANSHGGDMFLGIEESKGLPNKISGLAIDEVDSAKQKIENLLRDGVAPRMAFRIHTVRLESVDRAVLIVRVPASVAPPHMVTLGGSMRFYYRTSSGKDVMNVDQLRLAFDSSASLLDRIDLFRQRRVGAIADRLQGRPALVAHLVSFQSLRAGFAVDLAIASRPPARSLLGGGSIRFNFEGIVGSPDSENPVQLFRNGIVETWCESCADGTKKYIHFPYVASGPLEGQVRKWLKNSLELLNLLRVPPPFAVLLALVNSAGYSLITDHRLRVYSTSVPFSGDELCFPGVVLSTGDLANEEQNGLWPQVFNPIWNAGGETEWVENRTG